MQALTFGFPALEAEFWRWIFLMTRLGAALLAAPFFGATNVPPQARVIVTAAHLFSAAGLLAVLGEVLIGLSLGFVLQFAFAAPTIAAEIVGGGMGMGLAASVDPQNGSHSPVLGQYFGVMLMLVFFGAGAHLHFLALVVKSYAVFPPGEVLSAFGTQRIALIPAFAGQMFLTAVAMALPVTLVLLLVQVMAGVLGRSAPALNLFSLGLPAGIVAGIGALIASSSLLTDRLTLLTADALSMVEKVLE